MKNKINKSIKTGIFTGIVSLILMYVLALLRFGYEEIASDSDHKIILQYMVPVWAIALGWCGYGISKKYYIHKQAILGKEPQNSKFEKSVEWIKHRRLFFSKGFNNIGKITALMLPVYILAFLDNSKYLVSNIRIIIFFLIIICMCFSLSIYLKKGSK